MKMRNTYKNRYMKMIILSMFVFTFLFSSLNAARIKDIAHIEGFSGVQVIGYGLVSGLNQTGDNQMTSYTVQSVSNLLKRFGVTIPKNNPRMRNVAAVMVTATIPTYSRKGSKLDIKVSSIGDATSLQGGVLLMSPLATVDGQIVGFAQGALSVGGYDFQTMGSRLSKNFVTTGRVPNGLILETNLGEFQPAQQLRIILNQADFTTVSTITNSINTLAGLAVPVTATPLDAGTVEVAFQGTPDQTQLIQTISQIENIQVTSDPVARVIINERTGTIVVGGRVEILPSVIAHSGLEIAIQKEVTQSPQAPFTVRPPQPTANASMSVSEEINPATSIEFPAAGGGATVADLAEALNLLQVKPRDLIAIFQALKEAGSLQAELIIQ